jgi:STE24 endopeptidase
MNVIGVFILAVLIAEWLLGAVAGFLNLKRLRPGLPEPFRDIYDELRYRKSQLYLGVKTRFDLVASTIQLLALLGFWFGRGFGRLDAWVRSLNFSPVPSGIIFLGSIALLAALLSLPFNAYGVFVIEERFGFNRTTVKEFVKDRLKGLLLALVLGIPLLAAVLAFFTYAGANAWWLCWAAVTIYTLLVQFVAPNWILPLFNRFTPLKEGPLRSAIFDYARSIGFPLDNIFVMDGSRRSGKSNAFFTGFGRHKRIVLFDTLIDKHTVSELVAVLAHEMGHYKLRHILKALMLGVLQTGLMFYLLSVFLIYPGLCEAFFVREASVHAGLVFFALLYTPLDVVTGMLIRVFSRKHEYEADRFAVQTTGSPDAMVSALKKLSADNLTNLTPHPLHVFLNDSHPPVIRRIAALAS